MRQHGLRSDPAIFLLGEASAGKTFPAGHFIGCGLEQEWCDQGGWKSTGDQSISRRYGIRRTLSQGSAEPFQQQRSLYSCEARFCLAPIQQRRNIFKRPILPASCEFVDCVRPHLVLVLPILDVVRPRRNQRLEYRIEIQFGNDF